MKNNIKVWISYIMINICVYGIISLCNFDLNIKTWEGGQVAFYIVAAVSTIWMLQTTEFD